jgi:hypothetical protein
LRSAVGYLGRGVCSFNIIVRIEETMDRSKFLTGTSALFCAPAIIKAENAMKIWVPPSKLVLGEELVWYGGNDGSNMFENLGYKHATEVTYFGEEIDQIVRIRGESVIIMTHPLSSSINAIPQFSGEIIFGNGC